jgi:hypothetical protein
MGGLYGTYCGEDKFIHGFEGKLEGKSPLGRLQYRWEYTIKMEGVSNGFISFSIGTNWQEFVKTTMNFRVP